MRGRKVFVVVAAEDYEGWSLLRAFGSKPSAEKFRARCAAYQATRPPSPGDPVEDTPENDALYDRWFKRLDRWRKRHPGNDYSNFSVYPVPYGDPLVPSDDTILAVATDDRADRISQ